MIKPYTLGVDVGGTFTDCVLYDNENNEMRVKKVLSTPRDPSKGVFDGLDQLLGEANISMENVSRVIHGTTLVSNAVIERKGARVGMITTKGFVNVLDIRREWRYDNYDFHIKFPEPLVKRYLRKEVDERIWYDGSVLTPLNEQDVIDAAGELVEENDVEALAICFLHSYIHPEHEKAAKKLVMGEFPELYVTTSSEISPYVREYERFSTTVINAYALPLIDRYLGEMEKGLVERGLESKPILFFVTSCSGSLVKSDVARILPVLLLESGPAAGVRIASYVGEQTRNLGMLSFDMGGTTAKGCIIKGGQAEKSYEFEVARIHRFKAGSGYPVTVPCIRLAEMGAGGGSIAKVDVRGLLQVGPESSGAEPGPACYSLGGRKPTVTDADLILGYLNPKYFLGGQIQLDNKRAEKAISENIADPLNLSIEDAANGIFEIVNQNMSQAFRIHAAERGVDIRHLDVFAFGGAGPVHAWKVAANLYCSRVVVPFEAGIASAMGLLVTPLAFDFAQTRRTNLKEATPNLFNNVYESTLKHSIRLMEASGIPPGKIDIYKTLDMRYRGQGFNIEVELPRDFNPNPRQLQELFETEYARLYTMTVKDVPIEIYNFKALISGPEFKIKLDNRPTVTTGDPVKGLRLAYYGDKSSFVESTVYDRYRLQPGDKIDGPSIIEENTSTCVVPPESKAKVDEYYNLIIELR
jgi:N-methylhydantoinase A